MGSSGSAAALRCGSLEETGIPDLLHQICEPRETGVLHVARHRVSKLVYIDRGRIIFASSTDPDDRLGELLLRRGVLRVHQLENALACLSTQRRLGAILVDMGYLPPEGLVWSVVEQVKEMVFGLFPWTDGEYRFEAGPLPSQEVITLRMSTPEVLLGGVSRIDSWWRVLPALGSLDAAFQARPERERVLSELKLNPGQRAVLEALEQPTKVRDLCGLGLLPDFETCRVLWAFRIIGLIEPAAGEARRPGLGAVWKEGDVAEAGARSVAEAIDQACATPAPEAGAGEHEAALPEPADRAPGAPASSAAPDTPAAPEAPAVPPVSAAPPAPAGSRVPDAPPAPAGGHAAAPALDEAKVDAALEAFDARHRRLHALVHEKMGDVGTDLIQRSVRSMAKELPGIFAKVTAGPDGSLDTQTLKANILKTGSPAYGMGLELLLERELEAVAAQMGTATKRAILSALKSDPD